MVWFWSRYLANITSCSPPPVQRHQSFGLIANSKLATGVATVFLVHVAFAVELAACLGVELFLSERRSWDRLQQQQQQEDREWMEGWSAVNKAAWQLHNVLHSPKHTNKVFVKCPIATVTCSAGVKEQLQLMLSTTLTVDWIKGRQEKSYKF